MSKYLGMCLGSLGRCFNNAAVGCLSAVGRCVGSPGRCLRSRGVMLVCLREIAVFLGKCFAAAGES